MMVGSWKTKQMQR